MYIYVCISNIYLINSLVTHRSLVTQPCPEAPPSCLPGHFITLHIFKWINRLIFIYIYVKRRSRVTQPSLMHLNNSMCIYNIQCCNRWYKSSLDGRRPCSTLCLFHLHRVFTNPSWHPSWRRLLEGLSITLSSCIFLAYVNYAQRLLMTGGAFFHISNI